MKQRIVQHPVTSSRSVRDTVRKFVEKHPGLARGLAKGLAFGGALLFCAVTASAKEKPTDSKSAISGEQTPGKPVLLADAKASPKKGDLIVVADSGKGTAGVSASNGQAGPDPGLKTDSLERIQALVVPTVDRVPCSYPCSDTIDDTELFQSTLNVPFKTVPGGLASTVSIYKNGERPIATVASNGRVLGSIDLSLLGNPKYTVFAVEQDQDSEGEFMNIYIIPVKTIDGRIKDGTKCLMFTYDVAGRQLYQEEAWTLRSDKNR